MTGYRLFTTVDSTGWGENCTTRSLEPIPRPIKNTYLQHRRKNSGVKVSFGNMLFIMYEEVLSKLLEILDCFFSPTSHRPIRYSPHAR